MLAKGACLNLCSNVFDDFAVTFLAKGHWQNLFRLMLFGNNITALGVELVMAGQRPSLYGLWFDTLQRLRECLASFVMDRVAEQSSALVTL